MSNATMIVEGFLSADPETRESSGKRVANFSVAHQARRFNKQTNSWEDVGDVLWVRIAQWEADADLTEKYLRKSTLVRVEGEPVLKAWEKNGKSGVTLELKFAKWSIIPRIQRQQQSQDDAPYPATPPASGGDVWKDPGKFDDSETPF